MGKGGYVKLGKEIANCKKNVNFMKMKNKIHA